MGDLFFGSALAVARDSHTRIDFFVSLFSPKIKAYILAFSNILCAVFTVALAYISLPVFKKNLTIYSSGLHIPNAVNYFAVIAGSVIMVVYFVVLAIQKIKEGREAGKGDRKE